MRAAGVCGKGLPRCQVSVSWLRFVAYSAAAVDGAGNSTWMLLLLLLAVYCCLWSSAACGLLLLVLLLVVYCGAEGTAPADPLPWLLAPCLLTPPLSHLPPPPQVELFCISKLINCTLESDEEFICMDFHFAVSRQAAVWGSCALP